MCVCFEINLCAWKFHLYFELLVEDMNKKNAMQLDEINIARII